MDNNWRNRIHSPSVRNAMISITRHMNKLGRKKLSIHRTPRRLCDNTWGKFETTFMRLIVARHIQVTSDIGMTQLRDVGIVEDIKEEIEQMPSVAAEPQLQH